MFEFWTKKKPHYGGAFEISYKGYTRLRPPIARLLHSTAAATSVDTKRHVNHRGKYRGLL
jgi:hypothetical protein